MPYSRLVEIGRVALISYGPETGKLCTIVNILDHNRVLVDGPEPITGVHRHELNVKRIMLTHLKVPATLNATQKCAPAPPCLSSPLAPPPRRRAFPRWLGGWGRMQQASPAEGGGCLSRTDARAARRRQLKKLWDSEDVMNKWAATSWAKKRKARASRAATTDFDRFEVMLARKARSAARKAAA